MTLDEHYAKHKGQSLLWLPRPDREKYRGQCVQYICYYANDVLQKPIIWADAAQWLYGNAHADQYERVYKDHGNPNHVPPRGAIVVWQTDLPNSGRAGHIAACWEAKPGSRVFTTVGQNWGGKTVKLSTHTYDYVAGWLLPARSPALSNSQGDVPMVPDQDNYYQRFGVVLATDVLGAPISREDFRKYLAGQPMLKVVEILTDHPLAAETRKAQAVGTMAVRDKWDQQIYGLQARLEEWGRLNNELNAAVTKLRQDDQRDKAAIKAGLERIAELTAKLEALHDVQTQTAPAPDPTTQPAAKQAPFVVRLLAAVFR